MDTLTAHFTGETVVWRGPWHMEIPLDFHVFLNPELETNLHTAAIVLGKFLSEEYVQEQEEAAACILKDEDDD